MGTVCCSFISGEVICILTSIELLAYPQHVNDVYSKPLPSTIPDYGSSDHSSLAPSQSASNIIPFDLPFSRPNYLNGQPAMNGGPHSNYTLHIPPAHSISDFTLPNGHAQQAAFEQDQGSSAEEEENIDEFEVHENPRFAPKGSSKPKKQQHSRSATDSQVPPQPNMPPSRSEPYVYKAKRELETSKAAQRQRRGSTGVFGSIAALFHSKNHNSSDPDLNSGKWRTRTSKNLTKARHGDDSSDDERPTYNFDDQPVAGPSSSAPVIPDLASSGRLRKRSLKRSSVQPSSSAPRLADVPEDRGWMSDGAGTPNQTPRKKKRPQPISISTEDVSPPKASPKTPKAKAPNGVLSAGLPTEATLSRSSSLSKQSIMSAPATTPTQHTTIHPAVTSKRASLPANPNTNTTRRRTTSLNVDGTKSQNTGNVLSGHGYPPLVNGKGKSRPTANGDPGASLMSIVEDVRKNRDNWEKKQDPNKLLFMAKAPPPVTETHALLDFGQEGHLDINGKAQAHALKLERSLEPIEILNQVDPQPSPPHDKRTVPLRSALRSSRSPSPSTSPPPRPIAGPSTLRPPIIDKRRLSKDSDASSIASFVTVQEDFEGDADESNSPSSTGTPQPISSQLPQLSSLGDDATPRIGFNQPTFIPPAPPPHDPPPIIPPKEPDAQAPIQTNGNSHANGDGQPARRKSVRMALPPTFSATPPAIDEDSEDEKSKHQPWAGRSPPAQTKLMHDSYPPPAPVWSSRIARDRDMWENSSDEDEGEYGTARKMLSVFSKRA